MARRNHTFEINEYYHCYNRGTDKRIIFDDKYDYAYFIKSLKAYNSVDSFGRLSLATNQSQDEKIVDVISYCLLQNHFHIVLRERIENGISKFMQRIGVGYTMYFNEKNKRSGALFQGAFKSKHVDKDQDLQQLIAYVTYNYKIHSVTDVELYRSHLDNNHSVLRGPNSFELNHRYMEEVVEIIKLQRLNFD